MMHGFGWLGWGMGFGHAWWIFPGVAVIALVVILAVVLSRPHRMHHMGDGCCGTGHSHYTYNNHERFLNILNEKFAAGHIAQAEYEERKVVLNGSAGDDPQNMDLMYLKEKYARCEMSTQEYIEKRNQILGGRK